MPDIFRCPFPSLVENSSQVLEIGDGVQPAAIRHGFRTVTIGNYLTKIALVNANEVCGFGRGEQANCFLRSRGKCSLLMRLQLTRQLIGVSDNLTAKSWNNGDRFVRVRVSQKSCPQICAFFSNTSKNALIRLARFGARWQIF